MSTHSSGRVSSLMFSRFTSSGNDELRPRPLGAVSSCFLALRRRPLLFSPLLLSADRGCASYVLLSYLEQGGASDLLLLLLLRLVLLSSFCDSRLLLLLLLFLLLLRLRRIPSQHLLLLLLFLLSFRYGLDRGDRDWCAGVGADGPGRAPSPPHSMLNSGRRRRRMAGAGGRVGWWMGGDG